MGQSICELRNNVGNDDVILVTIITDGMENASKEYDGMAIKRLVSDLKEKGWVFVYIGTNQDVNAVADGMGIRSRMRYDYSLKGASDMFEEERRHRKVFYNLVSCDKRNLIKEDYFSLADKEEEVREQPAPSVPDNETTGETRMKPKGFWKRIKDAL
jgi:hypothetical protein